MRLVAHALAVIAFAALPGAAQAGHTTPSGAVQRDAAHGSGTFAIGPSTISFDFAAQATAGAGNAATGTFRRVSPNPYGGDPPTLTYTGTVTCLTVAGNVATFAGLIDASNPTPEFGDAFSMTVRDNAGTASPDDVSFGFTFPAAGIPDVCAQQDLSSALPLATGDVVVYDAPAAMLPTRTRDCRQGRWRRWHDGTRHFRNQGDCVSFVATDGRNPPSGD